jgi:hypothetical protein
MAKTSDKSSKKKQTKTLRPGQRASVSGEHELIRPRGSDFGKELSAVRGKPLPPAPRSEHTLRTKSGGYVIKSPVQSANTITTWSRAFKSK